MRFVTHPAPASIAEHVQECWLLEDDGAFAAGLPKPFVELVVSLEGVHYWRATRGGREHRYTDAWVTPLQYAPRYARAVGPRRLIGARLRPWSAIALVGRLPLGKGMPPPTLASLIGEEATRLRTQLLDAPDDDARYARFTTWLAERFAGHAPLAPAQLTPGDALRALHLAQAMQVTPRALRRRFARDIGLSPKQWLKLHRLDALLRDAALRDPRESLAGIALDHGFSDQSHLSRDVAHLTGSTPGALRRRPTGVPPHLVPTD